MIRNGFVRWTLAAVASLAILAVGVGLVWGPSLLTPKQARELVVVGAARLGLALRIDGPVRLRLLPRPALVADAVTLTGPGGFAGSAGQLTADLSFGPLLRGRFAPRDVNLRDATLEVPPQVALASDPASPATLRLVDARVAFGAVPLEHVDAAIELNGGRLRVDGSATWRGQRWRLDGTRDAPAADGASSVQATLAGEGAQAGVGVVFAARVAPDGAVAGHASAKGSDLSAILPGPAVAFAAEGRVTGDGTLLLADTLVGTLAGQPVQGSLALRLRPTPELAVSLTGGRFDVRPWLDAGLSAPPGFPVGIDLSAEAVPVPGGVARGVRLVAALDARGLTWREVSGTLPGEAALRYVRREAGAADPFDGHATLSLPDVRATLAWARRGGLLPADFAALPELDVASASLSADVTGGGAKLRFDGLSGALGTARVIGSLAATRADGAWPVEASLTLEPLDVPPAWPAGMALCSGRPVSLDLAVPRGGFAGMPLRDGHARLRCDPAGGTLVLDGLLEGGMDSRFAAGVAPDGMARALDLSLIAPRSEMASSLLPRWARAAMGRLGLGDRPGWLRMRADAADAPWDLAARLGPLTLSGTARGTPDTWAGTVQVGADASTGLGLSPAWVAWLGPGPVSASADLSASPTGVRVATGAFTAGTVSGRVSGAAEGGRLAGTLALDAAPLPTGLSALRELDGWTGGFELSAGRLGPLSAVSASASLEQQTLRLRDFHARLGEGTLDGELSATRAEPPRVVATLAGQDLSLDGLGVRGLTLAGRAGGAARLEATGTTVAQLASDLSGTLDAKIDGASLVGPDLAALGRSIVRGERPSSMPGGVTDHLDGSARVRAAGGLLAIDAATLGGPAGRVAPSGVVDLAAGTLDLRLNLSPRLAGPRDDPTLTWRVAGPLDNPAATLDPAGLDLWRATPP